MQADGGEQTTLTFWWGLQCKNQDCEEVFAARLSGDEFPVFDMTAGSEDEQKAVVSAAARAIEDVVSKSASLRGANVWPDSSMDVSALLQLCPDCGRLYFYGHDSFFLSHEPIPKAKEAV